MANISNIKYVNLYRDCELLNYGVDYLRLNFRKPVEYFEKFFYSLESKKFTDSKFFAFDEDEGDKISINDSNTNFGYLTDFFGVVMMYRLMNAKVGRAISFYLSYNDIPVPIMQFVRFYSQNSVQELYGKLDFYGSCFRMIEIGELPKDFIEKCAFFFNPEEDPTITRIDYKVDLFYSLDGDKHNSLPSIRKIISNISKTTSRGEFYKGSNRIQSWFLGSKKNQRYFIRMYNKIDDIMRNNKFFFYGDYMKYKVHRFEIQFDCKFTRGFTLSTMGDLIEKCRYFFHPQDKLLKQKLFYEYSSSNDFTDYNRIQIIKNFVLKGEKLLKNKVNPFIEIAKYLDSSQDPTIKYLLQNAKYEFDNWYFKKLKLKKEIIGSLVHK